jgi:hypothetical protein|tara:strand:+ start:674 stop:973 length:300 start_codon:yes stop_codon:yes gene_type:complete
MEMKKWSEYDKYLILADHSHGKHKIKDTYESFLNYKIVMDVLNSMAYTDKSTYTYNNNIYKKKITSEDAKKILFNVESCKWTSTTAKLKIIGHQLGLTI